MHRPRYDRAGMAGGTRGSTVVGHKPGSQKKLTAMLDTINKQYKMLKT